MELSATSKGPWTQSLQAGETHAIIVNTIEYVNPLSLIVLRTIIIERGAWDVLKTEFNTTHPCLRIGGSIHDKYSLSANSTFLANKSTLADVRT